MPSGTRDLQVVAATPCSFLPLPWTPLLGAAVRMVAEGEQRGDVAVGHEPDVAALAAVAAVRPAHGDVGLPPERDAARAAVAAAHVQLRLVDELGHATNLPTSHDSRRVPKSDAGSPVEIEVGDRTVRVSNPDRVYFPARGDTKLDLARYYLGVGDGIVNALRERPCMLHRFPNGVSGEKVHQKRLPHGAPPWVRDGARLLSALRPHADELCVTELADVIWAVQMSTVEFHPWNSRRADTERPTSGASTSTRCPTATFATVRRVAHVAHEVLDELGAVGWPKTSGGKGLHVYVRIEPARVRRRAPRRAGVRPRGRAPGAGRRHDDVVAQGPGPGEGLRRLQPERPRPHDRRAYSVRGDAGRHGVDADRAGTRSTTSSRATSPSPPCRRGSPSSATCTPASTRRCSRSTPLLEWAERDAPGRPIPRSASRTSPEH